MGKYMRKCKGAGGGEVAAMEVTQVVGVRTRSRATRAAEIAAAAGHDVTSPSKRRKATASEKEKEKEKEVEDHSCYLHLRSRRLFMTTTPVKVANSGTSRRPRAGIEVAAAGISRCSSTASSMDEIPEVGGGEGDSSRSGGDSESGRENNDLESSVNNNSEGKRESRETTASSELHGDVSSLESEVGIRKNIHPRISPAIARMLPPLLPPVAEIDEFFAAAEKSEADRFAAKYNFDIVKGVPFDGGRFEWAPLTSCSLVLKKT